MNRFKKLFCLLLPLLLLLSACSPFDPLPTANPYDGMVSVPDGLGSAMWVPLLEELPISSFKPEQFTQDGQYIRYTGTEYTARAGVDVSYYQGDIDWQTAAQAGVQFAIIRVGYRGYSEGKISLDERFHEYIAGALAAGLDVGVYFFSQAVTEEEAAEEARFVLEQIAPYEITMPVVFDWEEIQEDAGARTAGLDPAVLTACCRAFCETVRDAGYTPSVYFYRSLGYWNYDLSQLQDFDFWFAGVGSYPDFYYAHTLWQYSFTAQVPGIEKAVDLDLYFQTPAPLASPELSPAPSA